MFYMEAQSSMETKPYNFSISYRAPLTHKVRFEIISETEMVYIYVHESFGFVEDAEVVFDYLVKYARISDLWQLRIRGHANLATRIRRAQTRNGA